MKENYNIMVVDDTLMNLEILSAILEKENYQVQAAESGKGALEKMILKVPDIVLLDITMPEMDGFEVCQKMKSNPELCDIPVIFISALNAPSDKLKAFDVGGVDYIEKPFNRKEVLARVNTHLKICTLQKELQIQNMRLKDNLEHLQRACNALKKQDENWRKDLLKAQNIQIHILPESFPVLNRLDLSAFYSPSTLVGGDFFDIITIDDDKTAVFLADVSGHGIAAAMVTVIIHEYIQSINLIHDSQNIFSSPEKALEYFNHTICTETSLTSMHVTMIYAVIDTKEEILKIASAGHPAPVLITSKQKKILDIPVSPAIGLSPSASFTSTTVDFPADSLLLLYSDGLTEAQNQQGDEFDLDNLVKNPPEKSSSSLEFCSYIERSLFAHLDGNVPVDDVSFLVAHRSETEDISRESGKVKIFTHKDKDTKEINISENHITFASKNDDIVIRTKGKLTWNFADPLINFISSLRNQENKSIYIDLSECIYMDSTMLGTLFRLSKSVKLYNSRDQLSTQLNELGIYNKMNFSNSIPAVSNFNMLKTQKIDITKMGNIILESHQALAEINGTNRERFADVIKSVQSNL